MQPSQIPEVIARFAPSVPEEITDIRQLFEAKYPEVDYQGRTVFLFTSERNFGGNRHAVSIHGPNALSIPEHIYSYPLLTHCYAGTFPLVVRGEEVPLRAGECFISDRHVSHAVKATDGETCAVNIVLADEFFGNRYSELASLIPSPFVTNLSLFSAPHDLWRHYETAGDQFVRECVDRILCETFDGDICSGFVCDNLILALLSHLFRTYEIVEQTFDNRIQQRELLGAVRAYIAEHYREGNLNKMASELGYDRSYLSSFIKKTSGATFKQLVNIERMRHAGVLLRGTTLPIYEIAEQVGIVNLTAFYKRFKEHAGCTPQEYRTMGQ